MRFFMQDEFKRYHTKCIKVSSDDTTSDVIDILKEKFFKFDLSKEKKRFGIYELHTNGIKFAKC